MTRDTPESDDDSRASHSRSDEDPLDAADLNPFDRFSKRLLDGLTRTDRDLQTLKGLQ